jgi:hypothetical protein
LLISVALVYGGPFDIGHLIATFLVR